MGRKEIMAYSSGEIILLIIAMTVATYLSRLLPLLLLSRRELPLIVERWLSYVPVAVLATLLGPVLFLPQGEFRLEMAHNPHFWAALPALAAAILTRNMFITVLIGITCTALIRFFLIA